MDWQLTLTWHSVFYLKPSYQPFLGCIPTTRAKHLDVKKFFWLRILHRPQCFTIDDQRKQVFSFLLHLAYLHHVPDAYEWHLSSKQLGNCGFSIKCCTDVDLIALVDPQGRGSFSNLSSSAAFAIDCHVQDLNQALRWVTLRLEFKDYSPLLGKVWNCCQECVLLKQVLAWKGE